MNNIPDDLRNALFPFQREGVEYVVSHGGRALIGDEMGLGKTIQAIAVAAQYKDEWPVLIICPSSVRLSWQDEILRWLPTDLIREHQIQVVVNGKAVFTPSRSSQLAMSQPNKQATATGKRVVIISYDLVPKLREELEEVLAPGC